MTTTLVPADRDLGAVLVFANLLPDEIIDARHARRLRRRIAAGLAALVIVLLLGDLVTRIQTESARRDLNTIHQQSMQLQAQVHRFDALTSVQAQSAAITSQLTGLMTGDIQWAGLMNSMRAAAPRGVAITSLTGILNTATSARVASVGPASLKPVGSITLTGTAPNPAAVAAYLDALGQVRGLAAPSPAGLSTQEGVLSFTADIVITPQADGGRWTPKGPR